jgi:hypothetical protein
MLQFSLFPLFALITSHVLQFSALVALLKCFIDRVPCFANVVLEIATSDIEKLYTVGLFL